MLVVAILFVVFSCQCQGLAEQVPDTATTQNDPLEDKLASLLREQESTTASLLREQDDKWASLLREQDAKLADLTSLLQQQGQKLSDQERSHRQLEQKVSDQEDSLRHQDQKLSHQESLLQEQGARLSFQEALLLKQGRTIQQLKNRHVPPQSFPSKNLRHATNMSQPEPALPGKTSDSASHDVIPRSDDGGPLEAVVSHISQRVTEMGADINAFKTQTSGNIQTLQNSNTQQDLAIRDAQSSTFVHWGQFYVQQSISHRLLGRRGRLVV
ncbi:hypothetical protein V1264_006099 [Littorina saxatilis]|uniref:Uncharacterized protein n=1 Tax=Littorina saxatilis TaxID=31220 RepID=A0AAN9G4J3_9CAEN